MIDFVTKSVNSRTITAFFDTRESAQAATDSLVAIGVPSHQIQMTEGNSDSADTGTTQPAEMGFWASLKSMFLPEEDHHSYAEGLRRGGYLLSVETDDALYDRAMEVLDSDGAVDMDKREANWRSTGWTGYQADETGAPAMPQPTPLTASAFSPSAKPTQVIAGREGVPPMDDAAQFGTRDVSHGRTRLRSYVYGIPAVDEAADERFSSSADSGRIAEHMDVIASDGTKIGTVDHLEAGSIKLAKSTSSDGEHHYVSLAWVDHVDTHVHLNRSAADMKGNW